MAHQQVLISYNTKVVPLPKTSHFPRQEVAQEVAMASQDPEINVVVPICAEFVRSLVKLGSAIAKILFVARQMNHKMHQDNMDELLYYPHMFAIEDMLEDIDQSSNEIV